MRRERYWTGPTLADVEAMVAETGGETRVRFDNLMRDMAAFRYSQSVLPAYNETLRCFENMTPEQRESHWSEPTAEEVSAMSDEESGSTRYRLRRLKWHMQEFRKRAAVLRAFNATLQRCEDMSPAERQKNWMGYSLEDIHAMNAERDNVTQQRLDRLMRFMQAHREQVAALARFNETLRRFECMSPVQREQYWAGATADDLAVAHAERGSVTLWRYERLMREMDAYTTA